jgi:hydroxyethylthiazole kinase-like uncharacterized protein yjeF
MTTSMEEFNVSELKKLYIPPSHSHKGQNGKVLVIGGSKLFHAAPLWALSIASKIVDMVFFASVEDNNEIVMRAKEEFRNGIVVRREHLEDYVTEADSILIGPGLVRTEGEQPGDDNTKMLTETLLKKYPHKKWVIDGGSLQVISPEILPKTAILTPHKKEFEQIFGLVPSKEAVATMSRKYEVVVLAKGEADIVSSPQESTIVSGGNAGMTKGGTGDVLAGLVAALYAKNDGYLAACAASFFNKKAGESLSEKVGLYFNASDLVNEIPQVMKKYLLL